MTVEQYIEAMDKFIEGQLQYRSVTLLVKLQRYRKDGQARITDTGVPSFDIYAIMKAIRPAFEAYVDNAEFGDSFTPMELFDVWCKKIRTEIAADYALSYDGYMPEEAKKKQGIKQSRSVKLFQELIKRDKSGAAEIYKRDKVKREIPPSVITEFDGTPVDEVVLRAVLEPTIINYLLFWEKEFRVKHLDELLQQIREDIIRKYKWEE